MSKEQFSATVVDGFTCIKTTDQGMAAVGFRLNGEEAYIAMPDRALEEMIAAAASMMTSRANSGATEHLAFPVQWWEVGISDDGRFTLSFTPEHGAPTRFSLGADAARGIAETIQSALGTAPTMVPTGPAN